MVAIGRIRVKTTHAIWLIIILGQDLMATNIFTKFGEDRMKTVQVREQTLSDHV